MERPERARKRGRTSQYRGLGHSISAEAAQRPAPPTSRIPRQDRIPHFVAARGGSPTRTDGNTTFSHPTLPGLQRFGDLSVISAGSPLEVNFASLDRSRALLSPTDGITAIPHDLLYQDLEKVDDTSEVPGTGTGE